MLAAALALGACEQAFTPPTASPGGDPEAAAAALEDSVYASQGSGRPEYSDRSIGNAPGLEGFESAVAMLDPGECLLEYGRANGQWVRFVRTLPHVDSGSPEPFSVDYRTSDRVVYRATCNVPVEDHEMALEAVSWSPGNGTLAAGRGWRGAGPGPRPSPGTDTTVVAVDLPGDYDWCYVLMWGDQIIEVLYCGYDDDPCQPGEEPDGYTGECVDPDEIPGDPPGDPGDPPACDPSEQICEDDVKVECNTTDPVRGGQITCSIVGSDEPDSLQVNWSYTPTDSVPPNTHSGASWEGTVISGGNLQVSVADQGQPPQPLHDTVIVVSAQPRAWNWASISGSQAGVDEYHGCFPAHALTAGMVVGVDCLDAGADSLFSPGRFENGHSRQAVGDGGPNDGGWYVATQAWAIQLRTQMNWRFHAGGDFPKGPVVSPQGVVDGCVAHYGEAGSRSVHEVNTYCVPTAAFADFVQAIWSHEQQHMDAALAEANKQENNLPDLIEHLVASSDADLREAVRHVYNQVHQRIRDAADATHTGSPSTFWFWYYVADSNAWELLSFTVPHT